MKATNTRLTPAANMTVSLVQTASSVTVSVVAVVINMYMKSLPHFSYVYDLFYSLWSNSSILFVVNMATCEYNLLNTETLQM